MGQRIGVLQAGPHRPDRHAATLYAEPRDDFVASLVGDPPINLVAATLKEAGGRRTLALPFVDIDAAPWTRSPVGFPGRRETDGRRAPAGDRADAPAAASGAGPRFPARVFLTEPLGDVTILNILAGAGQPPENGFAAGARLRHRRATRRSIARCRTDEICLFAQETGTAIRRNGASATN